LLSVLVLMRAAGHRVDGRHPSVVVLDVGRNSVPGHSHSQFDNQQPVLQTD
jgi:hypothetical protein